MNEAWLTADPYVAGFFIGGAFEHENKQKFALFLTEQRKAQNKTQTVRAGVYQADQSKQLSSVVLENIFGKQ